MSERKGLGKKGGRRPYPFFSIRGNLLTDSPKAEPPSPESARRSVPVGLSVLLVAVVFVLCSCDEAHQSNRTVEAAMTNCSDLDINGMLRNATLRAFIEERVDSEFSQDPPAVKRRLLQNLESSIQLGIGGGGSYVSRLQLQLLGNEALPAIEQGLMSADEDVQWRAMSRLEELSRFRMVNANETTIPQLLIEGMNRPSQTSKFKHNALRTLQFIFYADVRRLARTYLNDAELAFEAAYVLALERDRESLGEILRLYRGNTSERLGQRILQLIALLGGPEATAFLQSVGNEDALRDVKERDAFDTIRRGSLSNAEKVRKLAEQMATKDE